MSQNKLAAAREFIQEKDYLLGRAILESLPNDPTATKWLTKLNGIEVDILPKSEQRQQISKATSLSHIPSRPIIYQFKTVKIVFAFNHDNAMNQKIEELSSQGWEFVSYNDEGRTNIFGQRITEARILSFRRPR